MARLGLYHNPGCSKSRGALEILRERGAEFDVVEYLKEPLDRETLTRIAELLPDPPEDLIRKDRQFRTARPRSEPVQDDSKRRSNSSSSTPN